MVAEEDDFDSPEARRFSAFPMREQTNVSKWQFELPIKSPLSIMPKLTQCTAFAILFHHSRALTESRPGH
jgi:hypothetical protein